MTREFTTQDRVVLLLSLVPYLLENGACTVEELSQAFEVEPRIIRGLVRFLGVAGIPGETSTYQHEDLFDIDWDALEMHDVVSLTQVVAIDDTPRFSSVETAALIAGLHALTPLLGEQGREVAAATAKKLSEIEPSGEVHTTVSISREADNEVLRVVSESIAQQRWLTFDYHDASGAKSERYVRPVTLGQAGEGWYLRAYCVDREAERTFAIDRMRHLSQVEHTVPVDIARPELSAHLHNQDQRTEPVRVFSSIEDTRTSTVEVLLHPVAVHRIADFSPQVIGATDAGWLRAEVALWHVSAAVRLVQAAPGQVIIAAPEAARQAVQEWAERSLAAYDV